ncbi:hypothetical protein F5148DRAFT_509929 [Russula earlei]|uniref:Uncharacterized protein n=1 Tax=Russula earlei TaxID=71964 RepID=A0ACC0UH04_9AGAM|nr:hypothetical protein F5148DRAFT_509929 [Russula earlei]
MESLRSKAPTRKGPKPVARLTKPDKNARKSRVDDKIKRRMSTRYATISAPTPTNATPPVPTIPLGRRGVGLDIVREKDEVLQQQPPSREDLRAAENKLLDVEDFDPDAYLRLKLANSTEAELRSLQSSLQISKDEVAADLQRNVFKNYAQFVFISKEIGTLENEMMELKESLSEWKGMPSVLHIEESASVADRRRNVRSSVADLRVLYANQIQNLHAQIEGSAKFVPTTPGRHVVAEMDGILALNAATYKPMSAVRFVLLDDAVLVARKRRRRNASESDKLVADRCWLLNEMLVLDTKDTATLINVFKVKHGKETHVYRTDSAMDKKNLLGQFRHVAEELATKKRKEREGEHERRKSLWASGGRGSVALGDVPPVPDWMSDLAQQVGMSNSAKETAERDTRWIGDFADQLNVAIALREWDTAVDLVEQGQSRIAAVPPLAAKLTPLTTSLTSSIQQALSYPHNHKEVVKKLISLLIRLDAGAAARTTFLTARTETARRLVRMIRFDGHIGTYISELAITIFTVIKHTADWFLASFKENEVASSFIEWAKSQIETFAEMFRIQVFSTDVDKAVVDEALSITHTQSRKLLQEFGLDFRFILDALLVPNPPEYVPPPVPILDPAPRTSIPASKALTSPSSTTSITTASPAEPASELSHAQPPDAASDLPPRSGRSTPTPTLPTPPTEGSTRTLRITPSSPIPSVAVLVQRNDSPSAQLSSPTATSLGRRTRSPHPPPSAFTPNRPMTPSAITPSRGTVTSTAVGSLAPPSATAQSGPASPTPVRVGIPSPALTPYGGTLPLSVRGSNPAPPPRSRERPGSAAGRERERPPPVSVPRREGYF